MNPIKNLQDYVLNHIEQDLTKLTRCE